jgi:hypothetical protein
MSNVTRLRNDSLVDVDTTETTYGVGAVEKPASPAARPRTRRFRVGFYVRILRHRYPQTQYTSVQRPEDSNAMAAATAEEGPIVMAELEPPPDPKTGPMYQFDTGFLVELK